jgi:aldehyde dehydrogenase (NAD(P)+)
MMANSPGAALSTDRRAIEDAVDRARASAAEWARLPIARRIALARSIRRGIARVAERMVRAAARAKGMPEGSPVVGEEWTSSPYVILRLLTQLIESLEMLDSRGTTPIGKRGRTVDGRLSARVFPADPLDWAVYGPLGLSGEVHFESGIDDAALDETRGRFHRERWHEGRTCAVLGAGNVNSIPAADVLTKMFNEGKVCVLKMNPVNSYLGPFFEEAFAEAIAAGWLQIVYGGAEEGGLLVHHPGIDEVHITGSDRTHDLIIWGPPGPERAARMARNEPLLRKEITSELGNITPVMVVPGPWSPSELDLQAVNVAGMLTQNGAFNCIAGKMLVLPRGWRHRDRFLSRLAEILRGTPARVGWYPGAEERWTRFVEGRAAVQRLGEAPGVVPWAVITGLDPSDAEEPAFRDEPFCAVLSETSVGSEDPHEFLDAAVKFANDRLWGTLSATLLVHPRTHRDSSTGRGVERAIDALRYGTVCVNVWPGVAFATGTLPWGGYPGASLRNIQSGRGWMHNTRMVEGVEKAVLRAPIRTLVKLPYLPHHRTLHVMGRRLTQLAATNSWARLPGVFASGLFA